MTGADPRLPLSCMTTPKCVLAVLSSGALGGTETTGGLDGFLLEVMVFSGAGGRKAGNKNTGARIYLCMIFWSVCECERQEESI